MTIETAELIWIVVGAYLGAGTLFGLYFAARGAALLDGAAKDAGLAFRALVFPGAVGLWPILLMRVLIVLSKGGTKR